MIILTTTTTTTTNDNDTNTNTINYTDNDNDARGHLWGCPMYVHTRIFTYVCPMQALCKYRCTDMCRYMAMGSCGYMDRCGYVWMYHGYGHVMDMLWTCCVNIMVIVWIYEY